MSETKTPVEVAAEAVRSATWAPDEERMSVQFARAALGSVDVEGLAEVLREHRIECTGPGEVTCRGCRGAGWMSWHAYHQHVAEAQKAWLTGGGA
jgi:hypothetical protein